MKQRWLVLSAVALCVTQSISLANAKALTLEKGVKGDPVYLSPRSESEVLPQMREHQCSPFVHLYYGNRAPKKQFMHDISSVTPDLDLILWKDSKRDMYRLIGDSDQPYVDAKRLRRNGVVPDAFLWTWNPKSGADAKPCSKDEPEPVAKEPVVAPVVEPVVEPVAEPVEQPKPASHDGIGLVFGVQAGYQQVLDDNYHHHDPHGPLWGVFGGVKLTDNLRWELGYQDYKTIKGVQTHLKTELFDTALRYEWPLQDAVSMYGKLGAAYWKLEKTTLPSTELSDKGFSPLAEIGLQYQISPQFDLGFGYQYVNGIGSGKTGEYDSHAVLLSLSYDLP